MTNLERTQLSMAKSLAHRAGATTVAQAIQEYEATGLQASDLGKYSHVVTVLYSATQAEPLDLEALPGSVEILANEIEADGIADAGYRLQGQLYASSLQNGLAGAVAELQAGGDPATVCERVARSISSLKDGRVSNRKDRPLTQELPILMDRLSEGKPAMKCVPTGIGALDAVIYGWQPTLCLLGADPGVGKSATIVRSAYNGACNGIKSAVFSLEDPPQWLATRLVSALARVEILRILYGKLTKDELAKVEDGLERLGRVSDNIITFDGSERAMAVERLCSIARSLVSSSGVQCVYVDHAGELRSTERDRHDLEVASQLSALRGLANATGIPVVVAMHMKRRLNAKPTLSDFANSSGAERKARLALALTREPGAEVIQAHVLKQTNGPAGMSIDLKFDKESGMVS